MKKVYHYCKLQAFKSIVSENRNKKSDGYGWLRLGNTRLSNDLEELKVLTKQYEGIENAECGHANTDFVKNLCTVIKGWEHNTECFAVCFSKAENKLELWERYGGKCKGVAIGFDVKLLQDLFDCVKEELANALKENNLEAGDANLFLDDVNYFKKSEKRDIYDLYKEVMEEKEALKRMVLRKHIAFKSEKEKRIVFAFDREKAEQLKRIFSNSAGDLRYDEKDEAWYIRFPLYIVVDVYTGPLFDSNRIEVIQKTLAKERMNCSIVPSDIPYVIKQTTQRNDEQSC